MANVGDILANPECRQGKHTNCTGYGWNIPKDEPWPCPCSCHIEQENE